MLAEVLYPSSNHSSSADSRHLALDRILHLLMDEDLGANTTSPNTEYPFVSQQMKKYDELKAQLEILEEISLINQDGEVT